MQTDATPSAGNSGYISCQRFRIGCLGTVEVRMAFKGGQSHDATRHNGTADPVRARGRLMSEFHAHETYELRAREGRERGAGDRGNG